MQAYRQWQYEIILSLMKFYVVWRKCNMSFHYIYSYLILAGFTSLLSLRWYIIFWIVGSFICFLVLALIYVHLVHIFTKAWFAVSHWATCLPTQNSFVIFKYWTSHTNMLQTPQAHIFGVFNARRTFSLFITNSKCFN